MPLSRHDACIAIEDTQVEPVSIGHQQFNFDSRRGWDCAIVHNGARTWSHCEPLAYGRIPLLSQDGWAVPPGGPPQGHRRSCRLILSQMSGLHPALTSSPGSPRRVTRFSQKSPSQAQLTARTAPAPTTAGDSLCLRRSSRHPRSRIQRNSPVASSGRP